MTVNYDFDGNGINQAALYSWTTGAIVNLGDLSGDTCGGSGQSGKSSSYGWAVDDSGRISVGTVYKDVDGDGKCESSAKGEIRPFVWDQKKGLRELDKTGVLNHEKNWVRAHAISGNGRVILGTSNIQRGVAWVDEGKAIDLQTLFGVRETYATSYDGTKVALQKFVSGKPQEVVLWNPFVPDGAAVTPISGLKWCVDMPYYEFGSNLCSSTTPEQVYGWYGMVPILLTDMNDDGTVIVVARATAGAAPRAPSGSRTSAG